MVPGYPFHRVFLLSLLLGAMALCHPISAQAQDPPKTDETTSAAPPQKELIEESAEEWTVSPEGLWYVLVYYTDDHAMDPNAWHWEDHLWVIRQKNGNLRWREYPIVVFEDVTGRFERIGRNSLSKVTGKWEPSEDQLENIRRGLQVNDRGALSKKLKAANRAHGEGEIVWESAGPGVVTSASVITFSSTWQIERQGGMPTLSWNDLLDAGRAESLDGRTEFRCERIDENGVVHGRFDRDGVRHGVFRLYPSGGPQSLKPKKKKWFDM